MGRPGPEGTYREVWMRSRGIVVTLVVLLLALFAALNWASLATPLPVDLVFLAVRAPLGLVLLLVAVALCFIFLLFSLFRRAAQLRQMAGLERALEGERKLNQQKRSAELEALETRLGERFGALEAGLKNALGEHYGRLEAGERAQAERLEGHVLNIRRELATDLEQIETSIRRSLPPPRPDDGRR